MTSPHSLVECGPDRPVHLVHATGTHRRATPSAQLEHADVETFKVLGPQGVKPWRPMPGIRCTLTAAR